MDAAHQPITGSDASLAASERLGMTVGIDNGRIRPLIAGAAACGALVVALFLVLLAPPAQGAIKPQDFDVQLEMGPGEAEPSEPDCTVPVGGFITCIHDYSFQIEDEKTKGTVSHGPTGISGDMTMTYSMDMSERFAMRFPVQDFGSDDQDNGGPPVGSEVVEFSGSGSQSGAWQMRFDDPDFPSGSSMEGMMSGTQAMELIDGATGTVRFGGDFTVSVVNGSGRFADQVGTGRFCHEEEFSIFGPPSDDGREGPPDSECEDNGNSARAAASTGSGMNLKLRKGKPRVRIVAPLKRLPRGSATQLTAVTAPRAACKAVAKPRGKQKRNLGRAKASSTGTVQFRGALARNLGNRSSKVKVACKIRDGKHKLTVRTGKKVRVG